MSVNGSLSQTFKSDSVPRRRAIEETHRSFVVEASAGTGKTSTLVQRILHLVLEKGPEGVPLPLSRICAITFTEKAAGEMKVRLRQHFEEVISGRSLPSRPLPGRFSTGDSANSKGGGMNPHLVQRAREALRDLETASISTFHSFAVSLLKERPIEAGLDPRFAALDETGSELFFREVWELWISRALADRESVLELALREGFRLESLEELARTLRLNQRAVRMLKCDSPPAEEEIRRKTGELLERGGSFPDLVLESEDKLAACLETALQWLRDPPESGSALPAKPGNVGAAANWKGGKKTIEEVRSFVREAADFCEACQNLPAQQVLNEVIHWITGDFLKEWEKCKREQGLLDFDDQLWMARELLRNNKYIRREFQERYAALLVDEFRTLMPSSGTLFACFLPPIAENLILPSSGRRRGSCLLWEIRNSPFIASAMLTLKLILELSAPRA